MSITKFIPVSILLAQIIPAFSLVALSPTVPSVAALTTLTTVKFACARLEGRLATVVKTKKGNVPLVVWDSTLFAGSGYSPVNRCQQVTKRFQNLHRSGKLKYLTAGQVKNLPVICATVLTTERCNLDNLLFTLRPGKDPQGILQKLNDIRNRVAKNAVVEESSSTITSNPSTTNLVDMEDWLTVTSDRDD
jgi:hypothetical protein